MKSYFSPQALASDGDEYLYEFYVSPSKTLSVVAEEDNECDRK